MAFPFLANATWVDFVNTLVRAGGDDVDLLPDFDAVMRWAREAGLLKPEEIAGIERSAPSQAARNRLVEDTRSLRSALRGGAEALLAGRSPSQRLVRQINELLAAYPMTSSLQRTGNRWTNQLQSVQVSEHSLLARIAADFAQSLASGDADNLRACADEECVLLFVDRSKNHTRRWCSMEICGNRAKAAGRRARDRMSD